MRIQFERTGGVAGLRLAATVDTDSLPPGEAHELQALVHAADFFNLPAQGTAEPAGADRFQYEISIESEGYHHTITIGEAEVPETLQPLLQKLTALARSAHKS